MTGQTLLQSHTFEQKVGLLGKEAHERSEFPLLHSHLHVKELYSLSGLQEGGPFMLRHSHLHSLLGFGLCAPGHVVESGH